MPKYRSSDTFFHHITNRLVRHYGQSAIMTILAYGTRFFNPSETDRYSDYDITIVFRHYPEKPLPRLSKKINLTILFWSDIQIAGPEHFRLYNHGEFYLYVLASAVALYGRNPFKRLARLLPKKNILTSLREQILLHSAKLAEITLSARTAPQYRNIRKYSFRVAQNYYFFRRQHIDYKDFLHAGYHDWLTIFSNMDRTVFTTRQLGYLSRLVSNARQPIPLDTLQFLQSIKKNVLLPRAKHP